VDNITYRHTKPEDLNFLIKNMREEDIDELNASGTISIKETLTLGIKRSREIVTAINSEERPVAIIGVKPYALISNKGIIWMLGTTENFKYRRNLIRDARRLIKIFLRNYQEIFNYVHVKNEISIRWLKALGFIIEDPKKYYRTGEYFMKFYMKRGDNHV
jgi:hypothetical protein